VVVEDVARNRTLLAFDFDGTLAPIVNVREKAFLRDGTRALLRAASLLYPCAVISGRERSDVAFRVDRIPLLAIVGNHGAEPGFVPDEEAFRSDLVPISIRVGEAPDSTARYSLDTQDDVDELLRALGAARARVDGVGRWEGLACRLAVTTFATPCTSPAR
jgi:trehalose-6-phosphatase